MGKTFKRNSSHRPKAHGKSFDKDKQSWKSKKQWQQLDPLHPGPEFTEKHLTNPDYN